MASNFGTNIKQLRINRNVTQAGLAKAVGVSVQAVSKWECGGHAGRGTVTRYR